MTYKEFLNTTTDEERLATFLYNFCSAFYSECLTGICDKPCNDIQGLYEDMYAR